MSRLEFDHALDVSRSRGLARRVRRITQGRAGNANGEQAKLPGGAVCGSIRHSPHLARIVEGVEQASHYGAVGTAGMENPRKPAFTSCVRVNCPLSRKGTSTFHLSVPTLAKPSKV